MKVLAIVQTWNREDPICGFTIRWMEALADRVDELIVLSLEQRHPSTRPNITCYSLGKEHTQGRAKRLRYLARWQSTLVRILRRHQIQVIFTHMSGLFTVLVAPFALAKDIPIVTWYAHREVSSILKLAHHLSNRIVTSAETAYGYKHDKVVVIGQGIDTALFLPDNAPSQNPPLLLSVGRLSPIKDLMTLIDAVHLLRQHGNNVRCALVGEPPERDRLYADAVRQKVQALELKDTVQFVGAVPHDQLVDWYRRCFVHVNLCPTGALDKAALEAMACGKPSIVANEGFRKTLGPWTDYFIFRYKDPESLACKIEWLLQRSDAERQAIGATLHQNVVEQHSLEQLADSLVRLFAAERP
jgi:glycosyltransferase involved in cell wall biosynthesis